MKLSYQFNCVSRPMIGNNLIRKIFFFQIEVKSTILAVILKMCIRDRCGNAPVHGRIGRKAGFKSVDIGLSLIHIFLHQMTAVGCGVDREVGTAAADTAFQNRLQGGKVVVIGGKTEVIDCLLYTSRCV